jgi:hypothetical protein
MSSRRALVYAATLLVTASLVPLVALAWRLAAPTLLAEQAGDLSVRGCIERDAASRTPIYKLAESPGSRVFRLTAAKDIDVPSHVGQTVDVTGTVADSGGRQTREPELVVKKLTVVRDSCTSARAR